ncbi:MAG: hypothetical protein KDE28_17265, partial [Anaerolineales bacterium]|nr:hypothetical protein [Anaerolineales bacterium]
LTLEAARAHAEASSASAWFVPLQAASDLNGLASAIGAALGLTFSGSRPLTEQLTDFLRSRKAILLLDNFEQLVAGPIIDFIVTLLQAAPQLRLLVTSRERLNLQAEELLALSGLPLPPAASAALAASPAVKLFVSRARRQQATFAFREDNREAIHTVCRLAAGLPLALELAAAWIRLLNPTEIAREMQQNLDFLATDSRDLPDRHRSIRAAFDASWQLLTAEEQAAFASLAAFRGGFTHEAAAAICGISHRLLLTLIDKSLLQRDNSGRYYCHPLAEQYAAAKLAQNSAAATELRQRHGQYFANLLQNVYPQLFTRATAELSLRLTTDLDNLRLMWRQAVATQTEEILGTARAGLFRLLSLRGLINEALELVNLALEQLPTTALTLRCQLLAEQAGVYLLLTRYQEGLAAAESGITLAASAASLPPASGAELRLRAGDNGWRAGQYPLAQHHLQTGLELALAANEQRLVARIRYCWGITVAYHDRDYARAEGLVREALALWAALADPQGEALANNLLGLFCYDQARWEEGLAFQ